MRRKWVAVLVAVICAVTLTVGCGGKKHPTVRWEGDVTLDGEPIPAEAKASIQVQLVEAKHSTFGTQADIINGHYVLPDVPQGRVSVTFSIYIEKPSRNKSDIERGIMAFDDLVPLWARRGIRDAAGSDNPAKNFDLTKKKPKD